jgi:predicted  nucleic acid-binding Zn-ribbon protein
MMTEDVLRERLASLEVEMRYMREAITRQAKETEDLKDSIRELRDLLTQAKGARWAIVTVIGIGGFIASYLPTLAKWMGLIPK